MRTAALTCLYMLLRYVGNQVYVVYYIVAHYIDRSSNPTVSETISHSMVAVNGVSFQHD